MKIIRASGPNNFTLIPNVVLRDQRLSWKARGLMAYLLSHLDGWQADAETLAQQGPDGRTTILSALKELQTAGYIERRKHQVERGRWTTELVIHDIPAEDGPEPYEPQNRTERPRPTSGSPTSVNLTSVGTKPQVAPEAGSPTS
jgi:helix-turn-helix protein